MKLRQKLAAVMAAAMVVTAVPVVTSAASTNTITRPNGIVEENASYTNATSAPALKIKFDSFESGEEFYLTLTNATYTDEMFALAPEATEGIEITKVSSKVAKVVVTDLTKITVAGITADATSLRIPLLVKLTGGAASVAITTEGSNSTVTEGEYTFANTSSEVATVTAGTPTSFNKEGKIGTITITESFASSMYGTTPKYALVELNDSDYKFDVATGSTEYVFDGTSFVEAAAGNKKATYTKAEVDANFTYGFAGKGDKVTVFVSEDADSLYVQLPNNIQSKSKGRIEITGLAVKATVKNPSEGNITVDVSGDVEEARDLVVAVNGNYSATITVADDKAVEILAGESEEVNFTIKETVDNTFTNGRAFTVMLENGYIIEAVEENNKVDETATLTNLRKAIKSIEHIAGSTTKLDTTTIKEVEIEDGKVVGFTFKPETSQTKDKLDAFKFTFEMPASIEQKGEVKVSVTSRDLDEAVSGVIANVRSAVEITSEAIVLKTGLMNQVGGKITITETEAGVLNRNEQVMVYLPTVKGITFSTSKNELPTVEVKSGDAQVSDVKIIDTEKDGKEVQALVMTIKRDSKEASTIEIADFHIDTDRTVAEGKYDVEIGGAALTDHAETIEMTDFLVIGTPNTEDIAANGLARGTSSFVIGESKYTLNGVEKTMDAKSYIQDPGYTMVPVRYVAEAFGIAGNDILFSNGVVTLFAGNRTVQLTNNSDVAVVNGAQIKLSTKVVVKEGRTYAPVGEIARILGISASWDNTTKTATFTNK